ncbi:hypothetical protein SB778_31805, partial [Paraburkholderia sp. SIMBA_050]
VQFSGISFRLHTRITRKALFGAPVSNPLHAGLHAWPDAVLAWYDGRLPEHGRRVAGAALFGMLLAFGAPALGVYTLLDRSCHRRLYGSARFANEADIRRAGLL